MKDCQFCGEGINETSYYCHNCQHLQKDRALLLERFYRVQILRYASMSPLIVLPLTTLCFYLDKLEWSLAILLNAGQFILIGLICFPLLPMVFGALPESWFKDVKTPYLLERIVHGNRMMVRNWVIFPAVSCLLVFAQIRLAQTKPSMKEFRAFLKKEKLYSEKAILVEGECDLLTYHLVANAEGFRLFVGLNNGFYSFDPSVFSEISK